MLELHHQHRPRLAYHETAVPSLLKVVFRAVQDLVVDQFAARQFAPVRIAQPWPALHHDHRAPQGLIDITAVHAQQRARRRQWNQIELILHAKKQRAFGACEEPAEVEGPVARGVKAGGVEQGIKGIAGVATGHRGLGKVFADRLPDAFVGKQGPQAVVDAGFQAVGSIALGGKLLSGERPEGCLGAIGEKPASTDEMVTGRAVGDRVGATRVVAHHPADHRPVGRRRFGAEEEPVGSEKPVELVADHARLHPHPPPLGSQPQDAIHAAAHVDHDAAADHLARQRRARRPRDQPNVFNGGKTDQLMHIGIGRRKRHRLRPLLILRRIGRINRPSHPIAANLALKNRIERRIASRRHARLAAHLRHHHHPTATPLAENPIIPARVPLKAQRHPTCPAS